MNGASRKSELPDASPRPLQLVPGGRVVRSLEDDIDRWFFSRKAASKQEAV